MFSFAKKVDGATADVTALQSLLESARRRITELTLENIKQANEIMLLKDYRGAPAPEAARPILMVGKDMTIPAAAANSEIGHLFAQAAV